MSIYPFSKHIVNIYDVLGTEIGPGSAALNKTKFLPPLEFMYQ